jgi:ASCH domain
MNADVVTMRTGKMDIPVRALLIRHPWIDMILDGKKTWEIRGSRTNIRGAIGLIPSRSGTISGVCDLVDCIGPLSAEFYRENAAKAGIRAHEAELGFYPKTYAWVLANARYLLKPVSYKHPSGAVIWVTLDREVALEIVRRA